VLPLAFASALTFALASTSSAPAETSSDEQPADLSKAKQLFDEGTARYDAADYAGAIEKFTLAMAELEGQNVEDFGIRGLLRFNIGRAHMRAFEIDQKSEHLRQAKSIFKRFIEDAEHFPDQVDPADVEEAEAQLVEIDRLLAEPADEPEPEPEPGAGQGGDVPPAEPRDPAKLRASGIGLTAAGAVLLAGGVGMLAWGAGYGSAAERQVAGLDDANLPPDSAAFDDADDFVAAERRKGSAWMAGGGVAAAVGIVGVALGVRQLVLAKRSSRTPASEGARVNASAAIGRDGVWVGVSGRF
jgi:hypothetical protein